MGSWILLGLLGFVFILGIFLFNALVKLRMMCQTAWSDIDVYLKKRHDLVPNLVSVVKGYAQHESSTLEKVVQARNQAAQASSINSQIGAEEDLSGGIAKIFALVENYPDLKANQSFLDLQKNLMEIENDLGNSRRYYNAVVRDYNTKREVFPSNVVAGLFRFDCFRFFEADAEEKINPRVQL